MQESYNPSGPAVLTCHFNLLPLPVSLSTAREMGLPFVWAVDRFGGGPVRALHETRRQPPLQAWLIEG
jgi:hypothetical protein